jgi:SEC-C motif-containing protein/antitoxin Xre/MbcA/ParS-like protein
MKPGRNDPCPCGSGKKYKQCCLLAEAAAQSSPAELAWRRIRRANEGLVGRMMQFTFEAYGEAAVDEAWAEFVLWDEEEDLEPWEDSPHKSAFLPWMLHHWSPDPDETSVADESLCGIEPTRAYLERKGKHLDETTRRYLEACLAAPFGFHEVTQCDPGRGFHATELITGVRREVLEQSGSQSLQQGDVLYASLVHCDGIVMMEGVAPAVIPPIHRLPILEFRRKIAAEPDLFSGERSREWDIELRALYLNIVDPLLNPSLPELRNTDGDELSLQRLIFDVASAQETFDALKHLALGSAEEDLLASAERAADGGLLRVEFPWSKRGNRIHKGWSNTTLGMIEIDQGRLSVHVNSDERAAKFKRIVSKALGARAKYRVTEIQSAERALEEAMDGERATPDVDETGLAEDPAIKAQLTEMLSRHYDDWLRQKLPALGGKTPLQVAKDMHGREMLEALVAQIERDGQRMTPPLDEAIPRRLRARLGLDPR